MMKMYFTRPADDGFIRRPVFELSVGFMPDKICPHSNNAQVKPPLSQAQRIQNGILWKTGDLNVKVQFYADNVVRVVKWTT